MAFTNDKICTLLATSKTMHDVHDTLTKMESIGITCEPGEPDTIGHNLFDVLDKSAELFLFACDIFTEYTAHYTLMNIMTPNTDAAMTELLNFIETDEAADDMAIIKFASNLKEKYKGA